MAPADSRTDVLLENLNEQQRAAVLHVDGPTLILAGAGSGKTRVITQRIAHLLLTQKAYPSNILAVTFTNKAAAEMRIRIASLFGGALGDLWVLTFHALGARLLRMHADRVGRKSSFTIYDEDDSLRAIKETIRESGFDPKQVTPERFKAWLDRRKFNLVNPEFGDSPDAEFSFFERDFEKLFTGYQARLTTNNAVDFNDLLTLTARLFLDAPDVLERYQERFRFLLVDEYQDTNRAQYHICRQLAKLHQNICVVGDEDQSIYSWRGADIRNILEFERDYPSTATFHLVQNYRSTKPILDAASALICNNRERRKKQSLWTSKEDGQPIEYRMFNDGRQEAAAIVSAIEDCAFTGTHSLDDIAVFYRLHAQSRLIEQELMRRSIPYKMFGGTRFFERREVKDVIGYLRVFANPLDEISLSRIINVPPRRIGRTTLDRARTAARESDLPLYAYLELASGLGKTVAKRIQTLHAFLETWRCRFEEMECSEPLLPEVRAFIEALGYLDHLVATGREDRIELVEEILGAVADFDEASIFNPELPARPLQQFLAQITLSTDQDKIAEPGSRLTLMTLHNAKGLEFPVVYLLGLDEGLLPYLRSSDAPDRLEEERRLCYVGMTRAMERLHISGARRRFLWGRSVYCLPSRFLTEMGLATEGNDTHETASFDQEFCDPFWDN